jgi:hypothetical protein
LISIKNLKVFEIKKTTKELKLFLIMAIHRLFFCWKKRTGSVKTMSQRSLWVAGSTFGELLLLERDIPRVHIFQAIERVETFFSQKGYINCHQSPRFFL